MEKEKVVDGVSNDAENETNLDETNDGQTLDDSQENDNHGSSEELNKKLIEAQKKEAHWKKKFKKLEGSLSGDNKKDTTRESDDLELLMDLRFEYPTLGKNELRRVRNYMKSNSIESIEDLKNDDLISPYITKVTESKEVEAVNSSRAGNPSSKFSNMSEDDILSLSDDEFAEFEKWAGKRKQKGLF